MTEEKIKQEVLKEFPIAEIRRCRFKNQDYHLLQTDTKVMFLENVETAIDLTIKKCKEEFEKENEFEIEGRKHRFYNGIIVCCKHFCDYDGMTIEAIKQQEHQKIIGIIRQKIEELKKEACNSHGVKSIDAIHESVHKDIIRVLQQLLDEIGDKK